MEYVFLQLPPPEDINVPFFEVIEAAVPLRPTPHKLNGFVGTAQKKKKHVVVGANVVKMDEPGSVPGLRLWDKILEDGTLAVYASLSGREVTLGLYDKPNMDLLDGSRIQIGIDCRCENLSTGRVLKDIKIWQEDSEQQPAPAPVTLSKSLSHRSKKVHITVSAPLDSLLRDSPHVGLAISYQTDQPPVTNGERHDSKHVDGVPIIGVPIIDVPIIDVPIVDVPIIDGPIVDVPHIQTLHVEIPLPISLILQPLPLDDDAAALLMKVWLK